MFSSSLPGLNRRWLAAPAAAAYLTLLAVVTIATAHGVGNAWGRGMVEIGLSLLCLGAMVSIAFPMAEAPRSYWTVIQVVLGLLGANYGLGALTDLVHLGGAGDASAVFLVLVFPAIVVAIAAYLLAHERLERALPMLLDVGILMLSLLALLTPLVATALFHYGGLRSLADGIAWTFDLALFAGGIWIVSCWRKPELQVDFMLLVTFLGLAFILATVQIVVNLHGHPIPPWWLTALYGPGYLVVMMAPEFKITPPGPIDSSSDWTTVRSYLPYAAAAILVLAAGGGIATGAQGLEPRALTVGALAVVVSVMIRQYLLLHANRLLLFQRSKQALRDPLTGLLNRRAFDEDLASSVELGGRARPPWSLVLLDLDGLKQINDGVGGHRAGDAALTATAQALLKVTREGDRCYRLGGDEFAILLVGADRLVGRSLCQRALASLQANSPGVSFSAGIAQYPGDGDSAISIYAEADRDLYVAKRSQGQSQMAGLTARMTPASV